FSAGGDPRATGKAYAVNVLGCILGPLFACYVLLPKTSERYALILLCLPFFAFWLLQCQALPQVKRYAWGLAITGALVCSLFVTQDFEGRVLRGNSPVQIRRDYAASVIAVGQDRDKHLLVNGM